MNLVEPGKCYRIAGRAAIVPICIEYGTGKRIKVAGYKPYHYSAYLKFYTYDAKTQKTIAELQNTQPPPLTEFRYNSNSKVVELDIKKCVPEWDLLHPSYSTDEIDEALGKPRR